MSRTTHHAWLEENHRYLAAALDIERQTLARFSGEDLPPGWRATPPLEQLERQMPAPPAVAELSRTLELSPFERSLLIWCAGAELDPSFADLLATAHHNPSLRRPTFGLALSAIPGAHWSALAPGSPLRYWRILEVESAQGLANAPLRIAERVLHYLAGVNQLDEWLSGFIRPLAQPLWTAESTHRLARQLENAWKNADPNSPLPAVQLTGSDAAARRAVVLAACATLDLPVYELAVAQLPVDPREQDEIFRLLDRETLLSGNVLLVDWDGLEPNQPQALGLARLVETARGALVLASHNRWPSGERIMVSIDVPALTQSEQLALWQTGLGETAARLNGSLERLTGAFNLSAGAIRNACASFERRSSTFDDLWQACREQSRPHLDDLAQRVQSPAGWKDLILPPLQERLLHQVVAHVRQRGKVYESWGFASRSSRGLGTSAVFAGPSGTGKTLAAEVLANELHLDLYRIDLSAVVSKYIGETEKNLRRLFDAAENGGAILFFDEADALFGKRSEVKDSHDRYANIEVSYLLQRMESYRGLSILATNLPEALDPAFLRRIRFAIHFPFPDETQRLKIWQRVFPSATPRKGIDYRRLALFDVSGGSIYNIALHAAFLAAEAGSPVRMAHLIEAARGEYMRLEKPFPESVST